jgi:hypothetical protein
MSVYPDENDEETRDWKASEFGEAAYFTDDQVSDGAVELVDGTQDDGHTDDEFGWTLPEAERAALSREML